MSLKFSLNQPVAVVIGSGAGGGVLANELAQGGIDVVCLEAGKRLTMQDVVNDEAAMFPKFTWLDQRESSGQTIPGFPAWTCKTVGGTTMHWTASCPRMQSHELKARSTYGAIPDTSLEDWPLDLATLEPYYSKAEDRMGVTGTHGIPRLPGNNNYKVLEAGGRKVGYRQIDTNNVAINSLPRDGRGACLQTGFCTSGCVVKAKWSTLYTEIPKAEQTGHFELRPESMAIRIEHDTSGKVDSVWYLDRNGVLCKQKARFVCVAGNAIETSRLLLNSTSEQFPDGLANRSGQVGRNYMRHMIAGVVGRMPGEVNLHRGAHQAGISKDERFDANDHLEVVLTVGEDYEVIADGRPQPTLKVRGREQLLTIVLIGESRSSTEPVEALGRWLADGAPGALVDQPFSTHALSTEEAEAATALLWADHRQRIQSERQAEMAGLTLEIDGVRMPFWYTTYGEKPESGRSLWISMHGGGGAPPRVNTQQWENQKRLYQPAEGVYVAPRAPTDTWNLWHQGHIDGLFDRLIENMIVLEDVNPEKVYVMGYSAGGDGVYHLAARMADRWAAAAMMAGHPNNAQPDSLRNTAFTLHMGGEDGAYNRNEVARSWKRRLAELQDADPDGYDHWVEIHEGKGHWMDREDAAAVPWMAKRTRNSRPERIVWLQGNQLHPRFYWLASDEPKRGARLVAERKGQVINVEGDGSLRIRLDDEMVDLDEPVIVMRDGEEVFRGLSPRTIGTIARTLQERGDPRGVYSAEIVLDWFGRVQGSNRFAMASTPVSRPRPPSNEMPMGTPLTASNGIVTSGRPASPAMAVWLRVRG